MPDHGGKRPGAGRPAKSASGAAVTVSIKVAPDVADRLREAAAGLQVTQAEVLERGIEVIERKIKRKSA